MPRPGVVRELLFKSHFKGEAKNRRRPGRAGLFVWLLKAKYFPHAARASAGLRIRVAAVDKVSSWGRLPPQMAYLQNK
jgi:hypothetical protein